MGPLAGQIRHFAPSAEWVAFLLSRPTREGGVMGDTHHEPTDYSRTTQPHAGIVMKDNFFWPGLILLVVAVFGMVRTAGAGSYPHHEWVTPTGLTAVLWSGAQEGAVV